MIRSVWLAIAALAWVHAQSVEAADSTSNIGADSILGIWLTEGGDSKVEISRSGATYVGRVVWLRESERSGVPAQDVKNANPALRSRPIIGLEILTGFARASNDRWEGGQIYSPRQGRSYPAVMAITGDSRLEITVQAGIMSKRVVWTR